MALPALKSNPYLQTPPSVEGVYSESSSDSRKSLEEEKTSECETVHLPVYLPERAEVIYLIVLLGHPGAGKGTFAQSLKDKGFVHYSIGDFFRSERDKNSDIGQRWMEQIRTSGILAVGVAKEVTDTLIKQIASPSKDMASGATPQPKILAESVNNTSGRYILDGHVRMLEQAQHLDELLNASKNISPMFIYINVDKEDACRRILNRRTCEKCDYIYNLVSSSTKKEGICDHCEGSLKHRDSDNEADAKNRTNTYEPHLIEVVKYYKNKGVLKEFNGNLSTAIPAGASSSGVLSASRPLIGESNVKGEGISNDLGAEFTGNFTSVFVSTNSDLAGCNPAGIADLSIQECLAAYKEFFVEYV